MIVSVQLARHHPDGTSLATVPTDESLPFNNSVVHDINNFLLYLLQETELPSTMLLLPQANMDPKASSITLPPEARISQCLPHNLCWINSTTHQRSKNRMLSFLQGKMPTALPRRYRMEMESKFKSRMIPTL